ncbi:hypothetical protein DRH27_05410 [Candidatus Falkowbacteria bacterium]|nr:MAG: hypothetical protein DRH27_05410 [Candidatus Falkowbacteria bacterium]
MSQRLPTDFGIDPYTTSGIELAQILDRMAGALDSTNSGLVRPDYAIAGTLWLDTTGAGGSPSLLDLRMFDGVADILIAQFNVDAGTISVTGALGEAPIDGEAYTRKNGAWVLGQFVRLAVTENLTVGYTTDVEVLAYTTPLEPNLQTEQLKTLSIEGVMVLDAPSGGNGYCEIEATNDATGGYSLDVSAYTLIGTATYNAAANAVNLFRITVVDSTNYLEIINVN